MRTIVLFISSLLLACYRFVGSFTGDTLFPIEQTFANRAEISDYHFNFKLDSRLKKGGHFEVVFPKQFSIVLASDPNFSCSMLCTNTERTFKLLADRDYYPGISYSFAIYRIKNPSVMTGVGNFIVSAKQGENIVAETKLLGAFGISSDIKDLVSTTIALEGDDALAGSFIKYIVSFKVLDNLPKELNIVLQLPRDTFQVADQPSCSTFAVNDQIIKGNLECEYDDNKITITGFEQDISANSNIGIILSMRNPNYSLVTDVFSIFGFKTMTRSAFFRKLNVKGITIAPGKIDQVTLTQKDQLCRLSKGKLIWLTLKFKLQNTLSQGSYIEIYLPNGYVLYNTPALILGRPWTFYVDSGLDDYDQNTSLTLSYFTKNGNDAMKIEKFASNQSKSLITFVFLCSIPRNSGKTSSIEIRSFKSTGEEVDKNIQDAYLTIEDVTDPTYVALTFSKIIADGVTLLDMTLDFKPDKTIPAGSILQILIDDRITISDIVPNKCLTFNLLTTANEPAITCNKKDRIIYFTLISTMDLGILNTLKLLTMMQSPTYPGNYYFDFTIVGSDGKVLQSFAQLFEFTPQDVISPTINLFPLHVDEEAVIDAKFFSPYDLIQSYAQKSSTDILSFMEFEFQGAAITDKSLGLSYALGTQNKIPCKSVVGLIPFTNVNINCTLFVQANPKIKITNYQSVVKDSQIALLIPKITNPNGSWTLVIRLVLQKNRLYTILSETSISMTTNVAMPNGLDTLINNSPQTLYSMTDYTLGHFFDLTFIIIDTTPIAASSKIIVELPSYDTGFLGEENMIGCSIADQFLRCYQFEGIDWIYIELDSTAINPINISKILLMNLRWPLYVPTVLPSVYNMFRFVGSNGLMTKIIKYPPFSRSNVATFTTTDLLIDRKEQKRVGVTYVFKFACEVKIPSGSTLELTLPSVFNLYASYPPVIVEAPELSQIKGSNTPTIDYSSQKVTISNLNAYPSKKTFKVILKNMRNPQISGLVEHYSLLLHINNNKIAESIDFISHTLLSAHTPGRVSVSSISTFPSNKGVVADYNFVFSLQSNLYSEAKIFIRFPEEYSFLPNSFQCFVSGGLYTFKTCKRSQNSIYLQLNSDYITGNIELRIEGIANPYVDETSKFLIYSYYDGQTIDSTANLDASSLALKFVESSGHIILKSFDYEPRNEAEIATYKLRFAPSKNVLAGWTLLIKFPDSFDRRLGDYLEMNFLSGLKGNIQTKVENRKIFVTGFSNFYVSAQEDILMEIKGVMNPNKSDYNDAGFISIGFIGDNGSSYEMLMQEAGLIQIEPVPLPLSINSLSVQPPYARLKGNYTFAIEAIKVIKDSLSGGRIFIKLPIEYDNSKEQSLECNLNNSTKLSCDIDGRNIMVTGFTTELIGKFNLTINGIINPTENVTTSTFMLTTYNAQSKVILERTYSNLDSLRLTFDFPGPIFSVNNDEPIYVERGSQSKDIKLVLSEICALDLQIVGMHEFLNVVPGVIPFNIGDIETLFRVSASMDTDEGEFYITWSILGDQNPPIYTPIKKSKVIVTSKKNIPIYVQEINDIPYMGTSLAVVLFTELAPDIGIEIDLSFYSKYYCLQLNTTKITFDAGQNYGFFAVEYIKNLNDFGIDELLCAGTQSGLVKLELRGVNYEIYMLEKTELKFNLIDGISRKPEILDIVLPSIKQTEVRIKFTVNDICSAFYIVALEGTPQPSISEVVNGGPPASVAMEAQYGILDIGKGLSGEFSLQKLEAEMSYVLYIYLQNRNWQFADIPSSIYFTTASKYNAAFVDITFAQSYINSAEKLSIFQYIAFLLSLRSPKVVEKAYNFDTSSTSLTQATSAADDGTTIKTKTAQTVLSFAVIAETKSKVYPTPIVLATALNSKKEKLKDMFTNFNLNAPIVIKEFSRLTYQICHWIFKRSSYAQSNL